MNSHTKALPATAESGATCSKTKLGPAHFFAACAIPLIIYQIWALVGWIADGPYQITIGRDTNSLEYILAKAFEVTALLLTVIIITHVVRESRRIGRISTDGLIIIGCYTASFWDPVYNWLTPAWFYSTNFINVNTWFAHAPLFVNPLAGVMAWPVILCWITYPIYCWGLAVIICKIMKSAKMRRPDLSNTGVVVMCIILGAVFTVVTYGTFRSTNLMVSPGYTFFGLGKLSETLFISISGGAVPAALACILYFRNKEGLAFFEIGARRCMTRVLAGMAVCQLVVMLFWGFLTAPFSLFSDPYPKLPLHVTANLVDTPGVTGTPYGPSPGTEGFKLPIRQTMPKK